MKKAKMKKILSHTKTQNEDTRNGFLITKQTRLFYRIKVKVENITLLNFFDTRQEGSKKF